MLRIYPASEPVRLVARILPSHPRLPTKRYVKRYNKVSSECCVDCIGWVDCSSYGTSLRYSTYISMYLHSMRGHFIRVSCVRLVNHTSTMISRPPRARVRLDLVGDYLSLSLSCIPSPERYPRGGPTTPVRDAVTIRRREGVFVGLNSPFEIQR